MKTASPKKALLSSLFLASMIQPCMAGGWVAEEVINETIPNKCTGEDVRVEGTMLMRANTAKDGQHGSYTEIAKNVVATGVESGAAYTYRHKVIVVTNSQPNGSTKVNHLDMDVALLYNGTPMEDEYGTPIEADDLILQDFNMHWVFAKDNSVVTNIDFSSGTCE